MYPSELAQTITRGGYAVIPTDTIYGIVCSALNKEAVKGLYDIKERTPSKPYIVLIADINQLDLFNISWQHYTSILEQYWPGPVSIILPCHNEALVYLHRGTHSIAFRLPAHTELQNLIRDTGPLVAPSANPEGEMPARTIEEARQYFKDQVSCYVDGGEVHGTPSSIISIGEDGSIVKLR
jgi:L-threonylcarbamoyladenylate synthase